MKLALRLGAAAWLCLGRVLANEVHTHPRLILSEESARPGDIVMVGVQLRMDPEWHTYWRNPGGPGIATTIQWRLPPGVEAGEIQWPIPEKVPEKLGDEDVASFVYQHEVVLVVPLTLATNLAAGPMNLEAKVTWLECESQCVRGHATVKSSLLIADERNPSPDKAVIQSWQKRLPTSGAHMDFSARWDGVGTKGSRSILLEWRANSEAVLPDFYPYESEIFELAPKVARLAFENGKVRLRAKLNKTGDDWPHEIVGTAVTGGGLQRTASEVRVLIADNSLSTAATGPSTNAGGGNGGSLWTMLVYAFLGGLILNIMPCVLPVIALKILGFVAQAKAAPQRVRKLGVIYGLGVLASFLALAALVIGVKAAGHNAGWGMQFGNPQFIVAFTVLITLVALNLFGLFEVNLGGNVMNAAGSLASQHGAMGAFFNGVLATVLATPCMPVPRRCVRLCICAIGSRDCACVFHGWLRSGIPLRVA